MSKRQQVRVQATSETLRNGFRFDITGDICLDFVSKMRDQLSTTEPITAISITAGSVQWNWRK
jgi:hypothetical protein